MSKNLSLLLIGAMILTVFFVTSIGDERLFFSDPAGINAGPSAAPLSVPTTRDRTAATVSGPRRSEREIAVTYDFGNALSPEHPSVFIPPAKESVRETPLVLDPARHSPGTVPAASPEPGSPLIQAGPPDVRTAAATAERVHGRVVSGATTFFDEKEYLRLDSIVNPAGEIDLKAGATVETAFGKPEEFSVYCSLHRGGRGWIAVAAGPCFDLTDEEGAFVIEGVPPGTYGVRVWHERFNPVEETVTVEPGKDAEINFWMADN